jgi:hypothetical protein
MIDPRCVSSPSRGRRRPHRIDHGHRPRETQAGDLRPSENQARRDGGPGRQEPRCTEPDQQHEDETRPAGWRSGGVKNREARSRTGNTSTKPGPTGWGSGGVPPAGVWGLGPHKTYRHEKSARRALRAHLADSWRCRESNPGPPSLHEGFSVRSPLCLYSDPPVTRTSRCDDPSRCVVSPSAPRPGERVSPLADAGLRVGNAPGPTAPQWIRQRERSRSGGPEPGRAAY